MEHAVKDAAAANGNGTNQADEHQHAAEQAQVHKLVGAQRQAAGDAAEEGKPRHIMYAGVAPHDPVHAAKQISRHVNDQNHWHILKHRLCMAVRNLHFKAQLHAHINGQAHQHNIQHKHADFAHPQMPFKYIHRCISPMGA